MSALLISTINVKNPDKLQEYVSKVRPVLAKYNGEVVHGGPVERLVHGEALTHQIAMVVKFPDQDTLTKCLESPEYSAVIPTRDAAADVTMVAYGEMAA